MHKKKYSFRSTSAAFLDAVCKILEAKFEVRVGYTSQALNGTLTISAEKQEDLEAATTFVRDTPSYTATLTPVA